MLGLPPKMINSIYSNFHYMVEIYLDPNIIVIATIIIVGVIAFFDFLPYKRRVVLVEEDPVEVIGLSST
ncbi:TPA: hypothetical protein HA344_04515 [Candidatus Bathyarchaeota archaeon]|nr:hypothetical protein [Candidatus Bathyarchaeota archaeon]